MKCRPALVAWSLFALTLLPTQSAPLRVGVFEEPPYALKTANGQWQGLSVELWREIAKRAQRDFELVEIPAENIPAAFEQGHIDVAVGDLPVDASLASQMDFSHPYINSHLGVIVTTRRWRTDWLLVAQDLLTWDIARAVLAIIGVMALSGISIWLVEHRHRNGDFGGSWLEGIGSGLWFSASTMTSTGYGDKTPVTLIGRAVAFFWMLVGAAILAGFIGVVASSVSDARSRAAIASVSDLLRLRVGAPEEGGIGETLRQAGGHCESYGSIEEGIADVAAGRIDAFIGDHLVLAYALRNSRSRNVHLQALPAYQLSIAFGFPNGSPLRHQTFIPLLESLSSPEWASALRFWLGAEAADGYRPRPLRP